MVIGASEMAKQEFIYIRSELHEFYYLIEYKCLMRVCSTSKRSSDKFIHESVDTLRIYKKPLQYAMHNGNDFSPFSIEICLFPAQMTAMKSR